MNDNEELEYNDGLGDLLREKERQEFSWSKTTIVLLIVVFGIFVGLTLAFNFSKNLLTDTPPTAPLLQEPASKDFQQKIEAIEKEQNNLDLIEKLEKSLIEADKKAEKIANVTATPTPKKKEIKKTDEKPSYYRVFTGTFENYENAKIALAEQKENGIDGFIKSQTLNGNKQYRIQVSAFTKKNQAEQHVKTLRRKGLTPFISTN